MKEQKYTRKYLQGKLGCSTVPEYTFKQVASTCTNQDHSPRAINRENQVQSNKIGASVAP